MREWVSIASQRNARPYLPQDALCPLCPQSETNPSEIPETFCVAVFENRNPSYGPESVPGLSSMRPAYPFGHRASAIGRCEVVVFSPEHDGYLGGQSAERMRTVISTLQYRTMDLMEIPGIVSVFPFENRGHDIGVTLTHPHGQIYAYPFIPPTLEKIIASSHQYGPEFFSDLLSFEQSSDRILYKGEGFSAFVPFAARWPVEVTLMPHRDVAMMSDLSGDEVDELAHLYSKLLVAIDALYEKPLPYISAWYQAPKGMGIESLRFHLKLSSPQRSPDKLKYLAGSEAAMGSFISDVAPEAQAQALREVFR